MVRAHGVRIVTNDQMCVSESFVMVLKMEHGSKARGWRLSEEGAVVPKGDTIPQEARGKEMNGRDSPEAGWRHLG